MICPYFKNIYNIGVCDAATDGHVPSIDELGSLCFKERYCACPAFLKRTAMTDRWCSGSPKHLRGDMSAGIRAN